AINVPLRAPYQPLRGLSFGRAKSKSCDGVHAQRGQPMSRPRRTLVPLLVVRLACYSTYIPHGGLRQCLGGTAGGRFGPNVAQDESLRRPERSSKAVSRPSPEDPATSALSERPAA